MPERGPRTTILSAKSYWSDGHHGDGASFAIAREMSEAASACCARPRGRTPAGCYWDARPGETTGAWRRNDNHEVIDSRQDRDRDRKRKERGSWRQVRMPRDAADGVATSDNDQPESRRAKQRSTAGARAMQVAR